MSHVVIETTVPVVVTSDDAHEPPVVVNAVQTTTVLVESAPEVIEVNAGPRGLPGPRGEKGETGGVPDAPLDGAAYARQSGAWVEALAASARGAAGGVASLDASGKVPESQIPVIPDAVLSVAGKTGAVSLTPSDIAGLDAALAGKADNNVALTDAAGTTTLPATSAAPVAARLQVLRNNIKQAFADLGTKQATLVSGTNIKTVGGQSLLGSGNVPTGEPLPTATTISRTNGVITSMTETVGGTSRVTTITRSGGVVTQIAVAHNGITRTETLNRTNGQVTGITVTET